MKFKRVLHPVGQGAFITEDFSNEEEGYGSTIVYDCGSISSKEILYREIDQFKQEHTTFNVLFISHFDNDHINGLRRLLEKDLADNDFIESLIKVYSIDKSLLDTLIKKYLIMKYPKDNIAIDNSLVDEDLFKKYSIDKHLVESLIFKYCKNNHNWYLDYDSESGWDFVDDDDTFISEFLSERNEYEKHRVVIVPFLYPHLIKILLPEMKTELSEDTYDALDALFKSRIKIIGIDNNDISSYPFGDNRPIYKDDLYKEDVRTIKSFTKIRVRESNKGKVCWNYMPYNTINDGRKERFLVELFVALKGSPGKIGEWFSEKGGDKIESLSDIKKNTCFLEIQNFLMNSASELLTDEGTIDDFINLLKRLYSNPSSCIRGVSVSAINVDSLNVLSFSDDALKDNSLKAYGECNFKLLGESSHPLSADKKMICTNAINWRGYDFSEQMRFYNYSCLYTGDCVMEDHFFNRISNIIQNVLDSPIGLLQIPHHGSKHNYNDRINFVPVFSSFVNFKEGTYTFADGIYSLAKVIPCFEITLEEDSRFEQIVTWKNQK